MSPYYEYNTTVLNNTLTLIKTEADKTGFQVHYAVKANANPLILKTISSYGFGADCVSGNEITAAIAAGFPAEKIVYAGVGKSDIEITTALMAGIACFNCESLPEIEVISEIASRLDKEANVAIRINPLIDAHTHKYITTGVEESKFGILKGDVLNVINRIKKLPKINFTGIHFHIGSQITDLSVFEMLCNEVNNFQQLLSDNNISIKTINVGGGLGVDYQNPEKYPDFENYFAILQKGILLKEGQTLHLEPGRSIVCQCGSLISHVLYVKQGYKTEFVILDAGMSDLIRPALYQAYHKIENITSKGELKQYDVVGPICESADTFGKNVTLPETKRGDIIAIRSAGAYGEVMASRYNLRNIPTSKFI